MPKWKIKRNALVQGLLWESCGINLLAAKLLKSGADKSLLLWLALMLLSGAAVAMDRRERNNTDGAVCCTLALHLIETAFLLTKLFFHWAIVVLYLLELALCLCTWRKK